MTIRFALGAVLAGLLLTGCSESSRSGQTSAPEQAAQTSSPQQEAPASGASAQNTAAIVGSTDPLDAEAAAVQRRFLEAGASAAARDARERSARDGIQQRVILAFRTAVTQLQRSGVAFDKAEYAFNMLQVVRRQQGVFPLQTVYQDADDHFRVLDDSLTTGPFAVVLLRGLEHPQSFGGDVSRDVLDPEGNIAPDCKVGIDVESETHQLVRHDFGCRAVFSGAADAELVALAKRYLIEQLKP